MKFLFIAIFVLVLTGCASMQPMKDRNGNPVPFEVDHQCKAACGFYDSRGGIMGPAICMSDCLRATGY
jgi:hypothetical protein